jgi:spermidine synthase
VLAAYMGGLAAGAALAARLAPRIRRPVLVYAALELGIAASALAVPFAIRAATGLYALAFGGRPAPPDEGQLASAIFHLACAFAILSVPTAAMGATLPLLARHAVRSDEDIGRRTGALYAVNTAGAVAGTLCAAFALLPALGLRATVFAGAAVNALVFGAALWLALGADAPPAPARARAGPTPAAGWMLPLMALSGFASFSYEVLWTRLLGFVLGGSVYAFATMLASFLVGIAAGSAAAARLATTPQRAGRGFAAAQLGTALLSLAAFASLDAVPAFARGIGAGGLGSLAANAAVAAAVLLPGALCIGAAFPFAVRRFARDQADTAAAAARIYAWNTFGAIAGAIAAGFWLLPGLGFAGTLVAAVALNLALAAAGAGLAQPAARGLLAACLAAAVGLAALRPEPPWTLLRSSPLGGGAAPGEPAFFAVGRSASVLLLDDGRSFTLTTNGLPEAEISRPDATRPGLHLETRWLGMLPVLAHPAARSLLLVGLGGANALEAVPSSVEAVDVIELEGEVVRANSRIGAARGRDPLADPRVAVTVNDARGALQLTDARWDAIVSQPSHPWTAGASHLYTREFFALARDHLAPGGVFVQWIGLAFVDGPLLKTLVATLLDVFPAVRLYQPVPGALLFLAADTDRPVEASAARALAAAPAEFARFGVRLPEDVAAACVLGAEDARRFADGAPLNTDDHNRLAARSPGLGARALEARGLRRLLAEFPPIVASASGLDPVYLVRRLVAVKEPARAERFARSLSDPVARETALAFARLGRDQKPDAARGFERALALAPGAVEARFGLLAAQRAGVEQGDPGLLAAARALPPPAAAVVAGWRAEAAGDTAALQALDDELAQVAPREAAFAPSALLRAAWRIRSGDPALAAEAVALIDGVIVVGARPSTLLLRARAAAAAGRPALAVATLEGVLAALPESPAAQPMARAALAILDSLAPDAADGRADAVRARLERRLR